MHALEESVNYKNYVLLTETELHNTNNNLIFNPVLSQELKYVIKSSWCQSPDFGCFQDTVCFALVEKNVFMIQRL